MLSNRLFEALEPRVHLSAVPMVEIGPDSIVVTGSNRPDHIRVESVDTGSGMMTTVQVNGVKVKTSANLKLIHVEGMGGDDLIEYEGIHMGEVPSLYFYGNDGNDNIVIREVARTDTPEHQWTIAGGGNGDDRIEIFSTRYASGYGNDGNDHLISSSGAGNAWHSLYGNDGDDDIVNYASRGAGMFGGDGNDYQADLAEDSQGSHFDGGSGRNVLVGGSGPDSAYVGDVADSYFFGQGGRDWTSINRQVRRGHFYFDGGEEEDSFQTYWDLGEFNFDLASVENLYQYGEDFAKG